MVGAARGRYYLCAGNKSAPELERCTAWNEPAIGIQWSIQGEPALSEKDQQAKLLAEAEHFA